MMIFCMPRWVCALFFSILMGSLVLQMKAQHCGAKTQSPIATDRPQITSSSVVVPCGSLQLENGFQETGNGGQQSFDFPETSGASWNRRQDRASFCRPGLFLSMITLLPASPTAPVM